MFSKIIFFTLSKTEVLNSYDKIFEKFNVIDSELTVDITENMVMFIRRKYFYGVDYPAFDNTEMSYIIEYYSKTGEIPEYISNDSIDRKLIDAEYHAEALLNDNLTPSKLNSEILKLWKNHPEIRMYYKNAKMFFHSINTEILKKTSPFLFENKRNIIYGVRKYEDMRLSEIAEHDPVYANKLRQEALYGIMINENEYKCPGCNKVFTDSRFIQTDHIKPFSRGAKTISSNLQALCKWCNGEKGDKMI